jgi:hypothetical protein
MTRRFVDIQQKQAFEHRANEPGLLSVMIHDSEFHAQIRGDCDTCYGC